MAQPRFFVDGASNDPSGVRIPLDPARFAALDDPAADALHRWEHYAIAQIGMPAFDRLRSRGLMIVPIETWKRAMALLQEEAVQPDTSSGAE